MADIGRRDIVLVVDDSPETLSFLTDAIERSGATVLVAITGQAALDVVAQITPDIVLMDAVMPGLDGFETCRRLKSRSDMVHVPVIFMTGLTETEHIVQGLEAGGVDYVRKPIMCDELLARIRVHLANARTSQNARLALDTAGRFLFAVDPNGAVSWCTPQAARLLGALSNGPTPTLPPAAQAWLQSRERLGGAPAPLSLRDRSGRQVQLTLIGRIGGNEILLRLAEDSSDRHIAQLKHAMRLTTREAEVLLWVSRGKSSRDIGDILGLSPRTVTKHLEQVYSKLGVENRTAASALASHHLNNVAG
jgi:DNA-binding response OmpR family regulator/DNA-binding CsgD family transcriptional regulator